MIDCTYCGESDADEYPLYGSVWNAPTQTWEQGIVASYYACPSCAQQAGRSV